MLPLVRCLDISREAPVQPNTHLVEPPLKGVLHGPALIVFSSPLLQTRKEAAECFTP